MKENLSTIIITVLLFMGGLLTGIWTQKTRPLPPPPMQPWGEFRHGEAHREEADRQRPDRSDPHHQQMREMMEQKMASLKPEFEAFHEKMKAIDDSFHKKLLTILNPEQKQKVEEFRNKARQEQQKPRGEDQPPGRPDFQQSQGGPPHNNPPQPPPGGPPGGEENPLLGMILIKPTLEDMTEVLKLDSKQQAELKTILVERRSDLLNLVDKTPPPTIKLGRLIRDTMSSIHEKAERVQQGIRQWQSQGRDPSPAAKIAQEAGQLIEHGNTQEAENLLNQALGILNEKGPSGPPKEKKE